MFKVQYVYELVDRLSPQIQNIQRNIQNASSNISQANQKITNSFGGSLDKLQKIGNKSNEIGKNLFLKTTLPLTLIGRQIIKTASDFQESLNKVDVAFGNSSESVKKFAQTTGKNFGIDRGSALDMAALFGDMSTSMGLSQEQAAKMSTSLVALSGDIASFKNMRLDEVKTALAGIYTGETESLKRLGVVMTEANLQQFALTQGIRKKISALTQAEKVMLRYSYVTQMTRNSQGDFIRTQEGFANQSRKFSSALNDLSITLGTILLPVATKIINKLSDLAIKFNELSPFTQKVILYLGVMATVIAPLLIALGLLATGIGMLVTPIGMITVGFVALSGVLFALKNPIMSFIDDLKLVYNFIKDSIVTVIDSFINKVQQVKSILTGLYNGFASTLNLPTIETNQTISPMINERSQSLNQSSMLNAGGRLDVNIRGLPKGSNTEFTPIKKNFLDVGVNSLFAE